MRSGLTITSACTVCHVLVAYHEHAPPGRHPRRGANAGGGVGLDLSGSDEDDDGAGMGRVRMDSTKVYTALAKVTEKFPKWKVNKGTTPSAYLDRLEGELMVLKIHNRHWFKSLPMVIPESDVATKKWIISTIVKVKMSWAQARAAFIGRFKRPDENKQLELEFANCSQLKSESVHEFANRFVTLCVELGVEPDTRQTIAHFERMLLPALRNELERVVRVL